MEWLMVALPLPMVDGQATKLLYAPMRVRHALSAASTRYPGFGFHAFSSKFDRHPPAIGCTLLR